MEKYSKLPVMCVITSASCGHCNAMRVTGEFVKNEAATASIPGGHAWTETFFRRALFGGLPLSKIGTSENLTPVVRCYEIHFGPMGFPPTEIFKKVVEFNEFVWDPRQGKAIRNKFRAEYVKVPEAKSDENPNGDLRVVSTINGVSVTNKKSFVDFLALNIPTQLYNYIRFYPTWFFSSAESWNGALMANMAENVFRPLIGYIPGAHTVLKGTNGTKEMFGISNPSGEKMEDILVVVSKLVMGKLEVPVSQFKNSRELAGGPSLSEEALKRAVVPPVVEKQASLPANVNQTDTSQAALVQSVPLPVPASTPALQRADSVQQSGPKGDSVQGPNLAGTGVNPAKVECSPEDVYCRSLNYRIIGNAS